MPRFTPISVRGSVVGIIASYWFVSAAAIVLIGVLGRTNPTAALVIVVACAALFFLATFFAGGAEITATADEVIVRRRLRPEWRVRAADLVTVEEHIPLRPRARSLAGWVFKASGVAGEEKTTIELSLFSPADRRRLRRAFADLLVSPDLGRPR